MTRYFKPLAYAVATIGLCALLLPIILDAWENSRFQGTWRMVSVTVDGKAMADSDVNRWLVKIQGDSLVFDEPEAKYTARFSFDRSTSPKHLDIAQRDAAVMDGTRHGIYSMENLRLHVCVPIQPRAARPENFESSENSGHILVELVRME